MMDEMLPDCTPEERRNVELVREYMGIACDPKRASAKNVATFAHRTTSSRPRRPSPASAPSSNTPRSTAR
jgi:hypothetical protein